MSGRSNRVVGQAGEFAVCAELGKLGLIACPFAGNVPGFDVLAVDEDLNCVPIQVKTSRGKSWITGDISNFVEVTRDGQKLILGEPKSPRYPNLIRVYVSLGKAGDRNRYFILTESEFYAESVKSINEWLAGYGGIRPRNPDSLHSAINIKVLEPFENRWSLVEDQLKGLQDQRVKN